MSLITLYNLLLVFVLLILGPFESVEGASCPQGFYKDKSIPEGNPCSPVKKPGESCKTSAQCNQTKLLECISNICQCPPTSIYQQQVRGINATKVGLSKRGMCVGRVGNKCSIDKPCMESAFCNNIDNPTTGAFCACQEEFIPTSEKLCGRKFQMNCSDIKVCRDGLVCVPTGQHHQNNMNTSLMSQNIQNNIGGVCLCPPKYEEYDLASKTCKALVGTPCKNASLNCVEKATCIKNGNQTLCKCQEGFVETAEGKCDIEFGKKCDYLNVKSTGQMKCDRVAELVCKKGICSCRNGKDIYDPKRRQCLTMTGVRCQSEKDCLTGASCLKTVNKLWGRCSKNE